MSNDNKTPRPRNRHPLKYFVALALFGGWLFTYGREVGSEAALTLILIVVGGFSWLAFKRDSEENSDRLAALRNLFFASGGILALDLAASVGIYEITLQIIILTVLALRLTGKL